MFPARPCRYQAARNRRARSRCLRPPPRRSRKLLPHHRSHSCDSYPSCTVQNNARTIAKAQHEAALVRQARADYLREKGESQDATKQKDAAFRAIETWLSDFFAVARIALEDNPQLLEALTKIVRS